MGGLRKKYSVGSSSSSDCDTRDQCEEKKLRYIALGEEGRRRWPLGIFQSSLQDVAHATFPQIRVGLLGELLALRVIVNALSRMACALLWTIGSRVHALGMQTLLRCIYNGKWSNDIEGERERERERQREREEER